LLKCPLANRPNHSDVLGQRDKLVWREGASIRAVPPQQRLEAHNLVRSEIDDGLVKHLELAIGGLIVTELLINAIKYAYPRRVEDARILVNYQRDGGEWVLSVNDNGIGKTNSKTLSTGSSLGTAIVDSLAKQLRAQVTVGYGTRGLSVSVARQRASRLVA
jgi:two-component sensor histidine kinase